MANVIKHKRGSGSDPAANNLVLGELAIRTDTGKLFTKMDSGAIAEIAGGGSDIAINTLSSSSATGGGSATFNGSAYRFTLSSPPSVSAAQLLVSINGVIQKPVAGTGQPSEGFSVDGNDIILGDAPATGSDFFILTFRSLGVSEPADNSVTSAKIVDGAIVNADINASAAIAGTKISPDFGSQNIVTTGAVDAVGITIGGNTPSLNFSDANDNPDFRFLVNSNSFILEDTTNSANRLVVNSDGHVDILGNLDVGAGIDVTGAITGTGDLTIDTNTLHVDSSNNRVGIGTTSPDAPLTIHNSSDPELRVGYSSSQDHRLRWDSSKVFLDADPDNANSNSALGLSVDGSTKLYILDSGNVGIGTISPSNNLEVASADHTGILIQSNRTTATDNIGALDFRSSSTDVARIQSLVDGTIKFRNTSSLTERMRIDSSGRVGIGDTSPDRELVVKNASSNATIKIEASNAHTSQLFFSDTDAENPGRISLFHGSGQETSNSMLFDLGGTTRMAIGSSGKVSIGTTTPSSNAAAYMLTIADPNNSLGNAGLTIRAGTGVSGGTHQGSIFYSNATSGSGEFAGYLQYNHNNNWFRIGTNSNERLRIDSSGRLLLGTTTEGFSEYDDLTISTSGHTGITIRSGTSSEGTIAFSDGTSGDDEYRGLVQYNHPNNYLRFLTNASERMRIDASGSVGIGTTSPSYRLDVLAGQGAVSRFRQATNNQGVSHACIILRHQAASSSAQGVGMLFQNSSGSEVGSIRFGPSTSYNTTSDYRLKENVVAISDGITRLKTLKPSRFNWKEDASFTVDGFLAHEVTAVPEAITGTKDEVDSDNNPVYQSIDQSKLVPLLVAALQEAIGRIEVLEAK